MATYLIPLLAGTPQQLRTTIPGGTYVFNLFYCDAPEAGWQLELYDDNGVNVLGAIPLVTGADLFAQYVELNLGCSCWVTTDGDYDSVPTFDSLGVTSHLWITV